MLWVWGAGGERGPSRLLSHPPPTAHSTDCRSRSLYSPLPARAAARVPRRAAQVLRVGHADARGCAARQVGRAAEQAAALSWSWTGQQEGRTRGWADAPARSLALTSDHLPRQGSPIAPLRTEQRLLRSLPGPPVTPPLVHSAPRCNTPFAALSRRRAVNGCGGGGFFFLGGSAMHTSEGERRGRRRGASLSNSGQTNLSGRRCGLPTVFTSALCGRGRRRGVRFVRFEGERGRPLSGR